MFSLPTAKNGTISFFRTKTVTTSPCSLQKISYFGTRSEEKATMKRRISKYFIYPSKRNAPTQWGDQWASASEATCREYHHPNMIKLWSKLVTFLLCLSCPFNAVLCQSHQSGLFCHPSTLVSIHPSLPQKYRHGAALTFIYFTTRAFFEVQAWVLL